jgi:hypothetical protein
MKRLFKKQWQQLFVFPGMSVILKPYTIVSVTSKDEGTVFFFLILINTRDIQTRKRIPSKEKTLYH